MEKSDKGMNKAGILALFGFIFICYAAWSVHPALGSLVLGVILCLIAGELIRQIKLKNLTDQTDKTVADLLDVVEQIHKVTKRDAPGPLTQPRNVDFSKGAGASPPNKPM